MILSVEIKDKKINIIQASKKGEILSIFKCISINISSGVIDGSIADMDYIHGVLNEALISHGIKTNKAVFVINSNKIIIRKIKLPLLKKKKETISMLTNELAQLIPVDLNLYKFKYEIIKINDDENNYAHYVVYCMPLNILNQYYELAGRLKLKSSSVDVSCNCLNKLSSHNLHINKTVIKDNVAAIAEIRADKIFFSVLNKGVTDFSITTMLDNGYSDEAADELQAAHIAGDFHVNDNFSYKLLDEISNCIRFYQSIDHESKINKIYIYGLADNLDSLLLVIS